MRLRCSLLFVSIVICAVLQVLAVASLRVKPAHPKLATRAEGSFTEGGGWYPGEPLAQASGVRAWGSWSGSDENVGTLSVGPLPAPRILRFGVGGYPNNAGNSLRVEVVGSEEHLEVKTADVGERWRIVEVELPPAWTGRDIRITAIDSSRILGGWLAITEPIRGGHSAGISALLQSLTSWAIHGLLLGVVWLAAAQMLSGKSGRPSRLAPQWVPLGAAAIVAAFGYATFWAYFANALFGVLFSWAVLGAAGVILLSPRRWSPMSPSGWFGDSRARAKPDEDIGLHQRENAKMEMATVLKLLIAVGAFYLGLLHLFPSPHDFYTLAANRYREALPLDNILPHMLAERLFASEPLKEPIDGWLLSDRPPLQAGWQLLTWHASKTLGLDRRTGSGTSAIWFQLLWIAAAYGLLRSFAVERIRAAGWIATLALCGFFLQNTTFTWPKLSAAAFACGACGVLLFRTPGSSARTTAIWSAGFAGLAWLSHGGVAFSFLAVLPWLVWRAWRGEWREWLPAAAVLVILASPWIAYQKWYDPPGNRLLKTHLAGQAEQDSRSTWETIRDSYAKIGWQEAWSNKASNFHGQILGDWRELIDVSSTTAADRRTHEFFHTARALTWWPLVALLAGVVSRRAWRARSQDLAVFAGWLALTLVVWCLLMFGRYQASIHHGSYALMIGLFVLFSVVIERTAPRWLGLIATLQAITLGTTWAIGNPTIHGPATGLSFVVVTAAILGWFVVRAVRNAEPAPVTGPVSGEPRESSGLPASGSPTPIFGAINAWWQNPRLNFWVLAVLAALLALLKPHALHTPQLWAEDGSIFLMQADLYGARAMVMPYMGYLLTLPRLVASAAPLILDPAWWPAFYNGISFVIWLAVLARLFTPRFDLPGKPWLALAFLIPPHTGEVFFNITNLQWITAFVLIQQAIIAPPKTAGERVSDILILALVTLTGPFGIAFLPLFAWRWWCDRRRDNVVALAVVIACAAVQAWMVIQTSPRFDFQSAPLRLWPILVVLARRLVVWPAFGRDLALSMSPALVAAIGGLVMAALIGWTLRPHPQRRIRLQIVAAFLLITLAAIYRTRPDTWAADNLDFGDRYFYIPRVLLGWLLVFEFNTSPRLVANAARIFCLAVLLIHVRNYTVPAPKNYHWATHVEPIRQGVRADMPILPEGWTLEYRGRPNRK